MCLLEEGRSKTGPRRLPQTQTDTHLKFKRGYQLLDFNGDGTVDIVPESYAREPSNVVAWLNDGTGHYVALKSTMFTNSDTLHFSDALNYFAYGVKVRVGSQFKAVNLLGDGTMLRVNAGVVVNDAVITLAE